MKPVTIFLFLALLGLSFISKASSWQLGVDNDVLFKADGDYSNGIFLGYGSDFQPLPEDTFIPLSQKEHYQFSWSTQIGQKIWTPSSIGDETPQPDERPYSGLLYLDTALVASNGELAHRLGLMLGTTGPASGAEWLQKESHRLMNNTIPMGWDYQVKNTLAVDASYEQDRLFYRSGGTRQNEFSGYGRLVAGNFQPEVALGIGWRYGSNLASSFNATALRPFRQQVMLTDSPQNSGFLYGSFEARHRFDDLTITGSTLKPVHKVDVQEDQVSFTLGGVYFMDSFGVGFSVTGFSRSFKQDKKRKHYRNALAFYWKL